VSVAGSTDIRNSWSGTLGAGRRHPVVSVALQLPMLTTDRMSAPPTLARYAVPVSGISANAFGLNPLAGLKVACSLGATVPQPEVTVASQVVVSIADKVSSPWLMAKSVCRPGSTATNCGLAPVVTAGGMLPHPVATPALHRAPLITETVPSLLLGT
jgi:hypothetical protein